MEIYWECISILIVYLSVTARDVTHALHYARDSHSVFSFRSWFLQDLSENLPKDVAGEDAASDWLWQDQIKLTDSAGVSGSLNDPVKPLIPPDLLGISKRATSSKFDSIQSDYQRLNSQYSAYTSSRLKEIAEKDPIAAIFDDIETIQLSDCNNSEYKALDIQFPITKYQPFTSLTVSALKTANVLNNLFQSSLSLYNDAFFFAQVRSTLETDKEELIYGAAIAFEVGQYQGQNGAQHFCPYAYRDKSSGGTIKTDDIPSRDYASRTAVGYEWFRKQREPDYSDLLRDKTDICKQVSDFDLANKRRYFSTVITKADLGRWHGPYFKCSPDKVWILTYSVPFFGCTKNGTLEFKGVVKLDFDMSKWNVNQCQPKDEENPFAGSHRCKPSTRCLFVDGHGFRRGSYRCECDVGHFYPSYKVNNKGSLPYNGTIVEQAYIGKLMNASMLYDKDFQCLPCAKGCMNCTSTAPCFVTSDVMLRGIPLGIESFCMTVTLVLMFVVIRLRRTKVMKASMWALLEIVLLGALLLYTTVVILYFEPSNLTCILLPWFREVGFAIVYGALTLKIYRVLCEFQSRKAHRVLVRDVDMLKYLCIIVLIVVGYMAAWTAVSVDHLHEGNTMIDHGMTPNNLKYEICKSRNWDYIVELGEFCFLCLGIYLCYCTRAAPSDYLETRYISWAIYNETIFSLLLHIVRHFLWLNLHPDYIYLTYFIHCQLTVTVTLMLVLGPKIWYAHRPPEDDHFRNRAYSTSDVHDNILPESMKLHVGISSNGDVDLGELNLSDMDPEDIRSELKRLYTQLQIYKTRTMRKDNPHISKRRGGRKQTHRRFSLQAFHHKHKHHHHSSDDHDHEMSKTPEESTNSAEGIAISMCEESSIGEMRTPTVTFKPGHKSIC